MSTITNILFNLLAVCRERKIDLVLQKKDDTNHIRYVPNKELILNLGNPEDENLEQYLKDSLKELFD